MIKRVITIVLDGFGVGELPDSRDYNDEGSNTLAGIYNNTNLSIPNLKKLGLYHIDGVKLEENNEEAIGCYRKSKRKISWKKQPSRSLGNCRICYKSRI